MKQKPPFTLISSGISHNTVEALNQLAIEASNGEIIGIAFVAMRQGRTYFTDVAGEARRNPTFARGMLAALDDELSNMIHRSGD